jgi:ATP-dependent RNA helicase DeaD
LLSEGCARVLVYSRSADQAADLGDVLALRGFAVGRPGDEAEVWLGVDPLETRDELAEGGVERASFAVLSADPPPDPDTLDRRHGGGGPAGVVVVPPRGLPHLRRVAREAGYTLEPEPARDEAIDRAAEFRRAIEGALESEDLVPYLLLLEPLIQRHGAAAVAGALAALIRKAPGTSSAARQELPARASAGTSGPPRPAAWARLFLSIGKRDGVGTRDLLGAIIGESGIKGDQVGRIDLKDTFSRVEVHDSVADRVIKALNGTSIRGRSVRADFDRGESRDQDRAGVKTQGAPRAGVRGKTGGPGKPGSRGEPGGARRRPRGPRTEE